MTTQALSSPTVGRAATGHVRVAATPNGWALSGGIAAVMALVLTIAVRAPIELTVLGLIAFGVLHNLLEMRYLTGRFARFLSWRFLGVLAALITGIVVCRLLALVVPRPAAYAEIGFCYLVLGVGAAVGLRGVRRGLAIAALAGCAVVSLFFPAYHFVVLTHLHNVVPLFFLWEWASRLPTPGQRFAFRAAQVGWVVLLPVAILLGAVDSLVRLAPGVVEWFVGDGSRIVAESNVPGGSVLVGTRFLVMFAFMANMHYLTFVVFFPRFAPDANAAFDARVPELRGRRMWWIGLGAGALLAVLFLSDYGQGKSVYATLASYHAYLEFPVLVALLFGAGAATRSAQSSDAR